MAADDRFNKDFRDPDRDRYHNIRSENITGPVTDWATDFSRLDPRWAEDPFPITDDLRQRCPIAHTERFGGAWIPTRYEDIAAIDYDTERFSSLGTNMSEFRPPRDRAPIGEAPPITSDPPFHHGARKLLLPPFTKTAVAKLEPNTRAFCHSPIDGFKGRDVVDAAHDYAQQIPSRVIGDLLGLPPVMFFAVLQEGCWPPGPAWLCPPVDRMTWGVVSPGPRGAVGDADERSDRRPAGRNARPFAGGRSA